MTKLLKTITGHAGAIYDVCVSGNFVYTTSADKYVTRWKLDEGVQDKFAIKLNNSGFRIVLVNDDSTLIVGTSSGNIHCFDLENRVEVKNLSQHKSSIFSLTYNQKNKEFYSADAEGYFCVWNSETFDLKITQPLACGKIRDIELSEDGKLVALSCQDGKVRILETTFFNEIITLKAHSQSANCSLFDGDFLYTGGKDAYLKKWNWKNETVVKEVPAHNFAIYDIVKQNDVVLTASFDKTIKIWDDALNIIERLDRKVMAHSHTVNKLATITENEFVSVGDDKKIIHWQLD